MSNYILFYSQYYFDAKLKCAKPPETLSTFVGDGKDVKVSSARRDSPNRNVSPKGLSEAIFPMDFPMCFVGKERWR